MSLKTIVKVSHLTSLSDARYCSGMGVSMLGFGVIPGEKHYVAPDVFQEIRGWVPGPKIVAELYGINDAATIQEVRKAYAPDFFELSLDEYRNIGGLLGLPCILQVPVPVAASLAGEGTDEIAYLLVNEGTPCSHLAATGIPAFASASTAGQVETTLQAGCYSGIAIQGDRNAQPGLTSYDSLGEILEYLEEEL